MEGKDQSIRRTNFRSRACFRGRSVLAPSASQDVSQDNINEIDNRILSISDDSVSWQCFTVKNPSPVQPQTCAVIAEIQGNKDTMVEIEVNGHCRRTSIEELCRLMDTANI